MIALMIYIGGIALLSGLIGWVNSRGEDVPYTLAVVWPLLLLATIVTALVYLPGLAVMWVIGRRDA